MGIRFKKASRKKCWEFYRYHGGGELEQEVDLGVPILVDSVEV